MPSLSKAKHKLNHLISHLESLYSPMQIDKMLTSFIKPRKTSFRLNRLKCNTPSIRQDVLYELNEHLRYSKLKAKIVPVPWSSNAYIMSEPDVKVYHLSNLNCHTKGYIHFQSLSSILPPLCLSPNEGDTVLDMCSAPGGKTLQLLEHIGPSGQVFANDVDTERMARLYRNMYTLVPRELQDRVHIRIADARKLMIWNEPFSDTSQEPLSKNSERRIFDQHFDCILLDAPCSGEGVIDLSSPSTYRHWSVASVKKVSKLQQQLIENAYCLLKPGGTILYSTCTLSPQENEDVVQSLLDHHEDMHIVEPSLPLLGELSQNLPNFTPGLTTYQDREYSPQMSRAERIFPTDQYEGFFICKLQKGV